MANKFSDLKASLPDDVQARVEVRVHDTLREMALKDLRQAVGMSQKALAEKLQMQQPAIAKIEGRTDMYISTLRHHIEAMGGDLEIIARFSGESIRIRSLNELKSRSETLRSKPARARLAGKGTPT